MMLFCFLPQYRLMPFCILPSSDLIVHPFLLEINCILMSSGSLAKRNHFALPRSANKPLLSYSLHVLTVGMLDSLAMFFDMVKAKIHPSSKQGWAFHSLKKMLMIILVACNS